MEEMNLCVGWLKDSRRREDECYQVSAAGPGYQESPELVVVRMLG